MSQPRKYQPEPLHGESDSQLSHLQNFSSLYIYIYIYVYIYIYIITNIKSYKLRLLREVIDIVVKIITTRFNALCEQKRH